MRFRTLVIWVVVLGVLAWAAYTIVAAGSSYLEAAGVVDQAVSDSIARRKAQLASGQSHEATRDFLGNVRALIIRNGRTRGLDLRPENVGVTEAAEGVRVVVEWSIPVTLYERILFNLPLSVTRLYAAT
jgi:hypothetical protein